MSNEDQRPSTNPFGLCAESTCWSCYNVDTIFHMIWLLTLKSEQCSDALFLINLSSGRINYCFEQWTCMFSTIWKCNDSYYLLLRCFYWFYLWWIYSSPNYIPVMKVWVNQCEIESSQNLGRYKIPYFIKYSTCFRYFILDISNVLFSCQGCICMPKRFVDSTWSFNFLIIFLP